MQWCQTVIHDINVDYMFHFPDFLIFLPTSYSVFPSISLCSFPLYFSVHLSQFLLASLSRIVWLHTPFSTIHSWCCFSHCSLCSFPFPTFRPVTALTGSGAGRDDSRTCFSLWVYYLCSGPFKTTQNGPGSQCGEFVLTSCLFLLLLLLLLPCSFLPSPSLWEIGRGLWPK